MEKEQSIRYNSYDDFARDWLSIIDNYNATMAKMYVNRKCELTALKEAFERCGARCYRTRIECECEPRKGADNRRNAVVVTFNERVILEIIRCKGCVQRNVMDHVLETRLRLPDELVDACAPKNKLT